MAMVEGCDTFVVLPPCTKNGWIIFGKNSDRPAKEVQEIVFVPAANFERGTKVKCTYVEIDQLPHTNATILSKPAWIYGAEMGANEHGVVAGNEAVWTKCGDEKTDGLFGMDLLRLGLERSETAQKFVEVVVALLERHGQGGCCSEDDPTLTYNNSFLVCDYKEAWILETAGRQWAAEKIESGSRNISNVLTIGTKIDKMSPDLKSMAKKEGWWDGQEPFDFSKAYGTSAHNDRLINGTKLLQKHSESKSFSIADMMSILRDTDTGICMQNDGCGSVTTSSQVSILAPSNSYTKSVHFFTGTPDPCQSAYKPFVFTPIGINLSASIKSPQIHTVEDAAKIKPQSGLKIDRRHTLYKFHEAAMMGQHHKGKIMEDILKDVALLEKSCVGDILFALEKDEKISDAETLFNDAVDAELKIYKY